MHDRCADETRSLNITDDETVDVWGGNEQKTPLWVFCFWEVVLLERDDRAACGTVIAGLGLCGPSLIMNKTGTGRHITRRNNMGLDAHGKTFCHVQLLENGRLTNRRVQHLTVQDADGRVYRLQGDQLPEFVSLGTGAGQDQVQMAEILLRGQPQNLPTVALVEMRSRWPKNRDILHMAIPLVALGLMRLLAAVAIAHP